MTRENLYVVIGIIIFIVSAVFLFIATDLSLTRVFVIAIIISITSDILIAFDNDRRNAAVDAKFHHKNELVGEFAYVLEEFKSDENENCGKIEINGEKWIASSNETGLLTGDKVRIIDRTGMTFIVEKV